MIYWFQQLSTQQNIYPIIPLGSPWLLLLAASILYFFKKKKKNTAVVLLKKKNAAVVKQKPIQDDTPYCYQNDALPRWLSGKESACQYRNNRRHGSDPCVGKIP